jgi:hypothetical protein
MRNPPRWRGRHVCRACCTGMTLVEMLVAMTATLLVMGAIAQMFGSFGVAISGSRAVLDLDAKLRSVAWMLRSDLQGATAPTLPPLSPQAGQGYFEIIEGPNTDGIQFTDHLSNILDDPFNKFGMLPSPPPASDDRILGDTDDVLLFTTRSPGEPFVGKYLGRRIESPVAEVAWFLRLDPRSANPHRYRLYRRQLLVVGTVGMFPFDGITPTKPINAVITADSVAGNGDEYAPYQNTAFEGYPNWNAFYDAFDISARLIRGASGPPNIFVPNTLGGLTARESRFMNSYHAGIAAGNDGADNNMNAQIDDSTESGGGLIFPFPFVRHQLSDIPNGPPAGLIFPPDSVRENQDVVLEDVIAFDVRVFDPTAIVQNSISGVDAVVQGDPGFNDALPDTVKFAPTNSPTDPDFTYGAYVDLGFGGPAFRFGGPGEIRSGLSSRSGATILYNRPRTYCTWSTHYESNGVNEDGNWEDLNGNGIRDPGEDIIDDATDGKDNNSDGIIDDPTEFETSPPYPYPLRGIEIRIRCYEPASRQVRQVTVRHTFVPH